MNINLARKIDFWAGIPICFIFSILNRIGKIIFPRRKKRHFPKNIVFIELSEMGSAILSYSAIMKTKEMFPRVRIYFWIFKRNIDGVRALGVIEERDILTIRDNNLFVLIKDTIGCLTRLWREAVDITIDMELFSRFSAILAYLSGARTKAGFHQFFQEGLYRGDLHDLKVYYNARLHISVNFISLVECLTDQKSVRPLLKKDLRGLKPILPEIKLDANAMGRMRRSLAKAKGGLQEGKKLVVLNPLKGKLLPIRAWPIDRYVSLAKRLLEDSNVFIVTIGLKPEREEISALSGITTHERYLDLTGKTTFAELLNLFFISDLFITHDSGPVHFAALANINMIVLFGPETPVCYAPLSKKAKVFYADFACSPCLSAFNHRRSPCNHNQCLLAISVDSVYEAAREFLG
ncbi:MAG: glycosyltransferase family 9 protein [Candidatus Omnitrophota bacterium]